jgi:hypothetical protein
MMCKKKCKALGSVYCCSVGPYIAFIFSNWILPDIPKITAIQPMFKKRAAFYGVLFAVLKYLKLSLSIILEGMLQSAFHIAL